MDTGPVCRTLCPITPQHTLVPNHAALWQRQMCMTNFHGVALDGAAAGIEPVISSHKSNALPTTPKSRCSYDVFAAVFLPAGVPGAICR